MIKQLHSKNTPSRPNIFKTSHQDKSAQQLLQELSKNLMQPRPQAIVDILAKAASM
jgi:hypothetical protein